MRLIPVSNGHVNDEQPSLSPSKLPEALKNDHYERSAGKERNKEGSGHPKLRLSPVDDSAMHLNRIHVTEIRTRNAGQVWQEIQRHGDKTAENC
jgi:hypothetical protein